MKRTESSRRISQTEQSMYETFLTGNFQKLFEQQKQNHLHATINHFTKTLQNFLQEKNNANPSHQKQSQRFIEKIDQTLKDYIVPISDIEIKSLITQSGNSMVFKGTFRFSPVAIKQISLPTLTKKEFHDLLNEILILQRIKHPNLLLLQGLSLDENSNILLITKLYDNFSLQNLIEKNYGNSKNFKKDLKLKLKILKDIACGLNYLHSLSPCIIHRDIKPANVFIGDSYQAVIGDFGLAQEQFENQIIDKQKNSKQKKQKFDDFENSSRGGQNLVDFAEKDPQANLSLLTKDTISTVEYMSPESLDQRIYGKESDVYSFSVLMFEFLSGRFFTEKTGFSVVQQVVIQKYRPSLQFLEDYGRLQDVIKEGWSDDRRLRPTFRKICQILSEVLEGFD